jgi:hypothetical protein
MLLMGAMHSMGRLVEQNDAEAVKWFSQAADQGSGEGHLAMAVMTMQGIGGLEMDKTKAVQHLEEASKKDVAQVPIPPPNTHTFDRNHDASLFLYRSSNIFISLSFSLSLSLSPSPSLLSPPPLSISLLLSSTRAYTPTGSRRTWTPALLWKRWGR